MTKIYIVMGNTGAYSDFREWVVDAWPTEEKAKARVVELEHLLDIHEVSNARVNRKDYLKGFYDTVQAATAAIQNDPNGDPHFDVDYTGSAYHYTECELKE